MALVPFPGKQSGALSLPPDDDEEDAGGKMSFLEHLDEFRKRVINSLISVAVGIGVSFFFIGRIYDFLTGPAIRSLPPGGHLIYTQPVEAFALQIQISLISGALLAAPYIMYQVWLFIAPGLYANEKKFVVPFVVLSTLGFVGGAAFNHYIAFPFIMIYFASFNTPNLVFMPQLSAVFGMYVTMLIGLGLIFQMPTVVFFLARMKVVTAGFLARHIKYAILLIVVVAAVVTPTGDPMTLMVFSIPMVSLYVVSIVIAWLVGPKKLRGSPGDTA
jgi:sec-independent protein translocase protein TatC